VHRDHRAAGSHVSSPRSGLLVAGQRHNRVLPPLLTPSPWPSGCRRRSTAEEELLDAEGVILPEEEAEPAESEELVSEFREFIEGIRPEDFES